MRGASGQRITSKAAARLGTAGLLVALGSVSVVGLGVLAAGPASASSPCGTSGVFSASGVTDTCSYTSQGTEDTFTVPPTVTAVSVIAVGAAGGAAFGHAGGLGAQVVNTALPVTPSSTLWVDVGQAGPATRVLVEGAVPRPC
jgi:hypothetical protein